MDRTINLRYTYQYLALFVFALLFAIHGQLVLSRLWMNLATVELSKGILSGQMELCVGEHSSIDLAEKLVEMVLVPQSESEIRDFLATVHLWRADLEQVMALWQKTGYPIDYFLGKALQSHQIGHYRCALNQYSAIAMIWPNSSLPWYYMGQTYSRQGEYQEALDMYDQAVVRNSFKETGIRLGDVYLQKGEVHRQLRAVSDAYNAYSSAVKSREFSTPSRRAWAHYKKGEMLVWMGRYTEAESTLMDSIKLEPSLYHAFSLLGVLAYNQNDVDAALAYWQQAIAIEPNYASTYIHMARMYHALGDDAQAALYYRRALDIEPQNHTALSELTRITP